MKQAINTCFLVVTGGVVICVAAFAPRWLDDRNAFLQGFIKQDLLSILGVILAITLASASQIHLKFNDLEERVGRPFLQRSRKEVIEASYALLGAFLAAVLLVFLKPLFSDHHFGIAFINGFGMWILLFNIVILFDITAGIFSIPVIPSVNPDAAIGHEAERPPTPPPQERM